MHSISRREFLQNSAGLAAALAGSGLIGGTLSAADRKSKKGDANDTLSVAVIGVNGRGMSHVDAFAAKHGCVISTICDADQAVVSRAMKLVEKRQGKAPKFEQDLRRVMDDKSIDLITTATPNHWHALIAIWGMQAGKDVYVEKPVSHNVSEGRRIVEASERYKRLCQAGTQSRSSSGMREAMDFLHSGKLGKIYLARGLCYKLRPSIGKVDGPQPIPKSVNYDLWTGPAPMNPLYRKNLHYDWHWIWDYGNGDLGNQGIHEMDKARWGLGKNELARSVLSVGGRFGYIDDGQTANTQICVYNFGDCELIFEVRGLPSRNPFPGKDFQKQPKKPQNYVGNIWYGTDGILVASSYTGAVALDLKGNVIQKFAGGEDHFGNFVKAVRSRNRAELNADILEGHLSSALCHLGNISYRLGSMQPLNLQSKAFGDDKEAYETLARAAEHLKESGIPLDATSYQVGRKLRMDPKTETFVDDPEANRALTRVYRKPFVVPEKILA
jgi:predicted dehydrogenase